MYGEYDGREKNNTIATGEPASTTNPSAGKSATSDDVAATLVSFKTLLDAGVITQAEFDAKKKQILDL